MPHLSAYQRYFIASTTSIEWNVYVELVRGALKRNEDDKVKQNMRVFDVKRVDAAQLGWIGK